MVNIVFLVLNVLMGWLRYWLQLNWIWQRDVRENMAGNRPETEHSLHDRQGNQYGGDLQRL